jgi:hypothetical protein
VSQSLPLWVWDLVMCLQQEEDVHPVYFQQLATAKDEFVRADWCAGIALALVPDEVRAAALTIADYRAQSEDIASAPLASGAESAAVPPAG